MPPYFCDRAEAGRKLAEQLRPWSNSPNMQVLALPRGGVPVAREVAMELSLPLDVYLVRKLGVPGREELAMGAIAENGVFVLNREIITALHITPDTINAVAERERQELARRAQQYRGLRPPPNVRDQTVLLVDDGLATGSTMRAAIAALRQDSPSRIIAASPVGALAACRALRSVADEVICPCTPEPFFAVGYWYADFSETSDAEVRRLLQDAWHP